MNLQIKNYSIATSYTQYTGLRHCDTSENSGEDFYHKVLNKLFKETLEEDKTLQIDLDGGDGFAPSFLDESFGNLVFDFHLENVNKYLIIKSDIQPHWINYLKTKTYIDWEKRRKNRDNPKVSVIHEAWYRLINSEFQYNIWETPSDYESR